MKSFISVVLILLCGMLSLTGYSSTTTPTTRKMDIIEKATQVTTMVVNGVTAFQLVSVENHNTDVGLTSQYNNINPTTFQNAENDYLTLTQYTELVPGSIYKRCQGHI